MNKKGIVLCNYAAAFVDILGQRRQLQRFSRLPDTSDEKQMSDFKAVLKGTVGVVNGLVTHFKRFFRAFSNNSRGRRLPESLRSAFESLRRMEIHFQRFSDGLFVFVPLAVDKIPVPINGVFGLLAACGTASLISLAAGHPIRGGIELGWGVEYHPDELYGSVVARAYELESEVARYPRFVVGEQLTEYIHATEAHSAQDAASQVGRSLAAYCRSMLITDDDGYPIIDYLGTAFRELGNNAVTKEVVRRAYEFVLAQSSEWKEKKDTELAFRYAMLRDYFDARLPEWNEDNRRTKS